MKVTAKQEDGFKPVKLEIILETQEEVDEFFGVVDHAWFTDAFPVYNGIFSALNPFSSEGGYWKTYSKLNDMFRTAYSG